MKGMPSPHSSAIRCQKTNTLDFQDHEKTCLTWLRIVYIYQHPTLQVSSGCF